MVKQRVRKRFLVVAAACLAVVVIFATVVPSLLRWRMADSEWSPSDALRIVDASIKAYAREHGHAPPDLSSLRGQIPSALSCDIPPCEYRFHRFRYTAWSQEPAKLRYSLSAQAPSLSVGRSFYLDETGILRATPEDREATNSDPPVEGWLANQPAPPKWRWCLKERRVIDWASCF